MTTTGTTVDEILAGNGRQHRVQGVLVRREHSQQDHDTGPIAFDDLQVTPAYSPPLLFLSSPLLLTPDLLSFTPSHPSRLRQPTELLPEDAGLDRGQELPVERAEDFSLRAKQE